MHVYEDKTLIYIYIYMYISMYMNIYMTSATLSFYLSLVHGDGTFVPN